MGKITFLRVKDKKELRKRQITTITQTYLEVTRQERKWSINIRKKIDKSMNIIVQDNQLKIIKFISFLRDLRCKIHQIITLP